MIDFQRQEDAIVFFRRVMLKVYHVDFTASLFGTHSDAAVHDADEFCDLLYNQGDIYEVSLEAVPHLVAALEFALPAVQARFIHLLGALATAIKAPDGDPSLIREVSIAVQEFWDALERRLCDSHGDVRLAALIVLTDLARINLPEMTFVDPAPYLGALPEGIDPRSRRNRLEAEIERVSVKFGGEWRKECECALAALSFRSEPEALAGFGSPDWIVLAAH